MEDNQINGDPLKDLYTQFNPKLKLANSYEEFKSVMQDIGARKDFFNEFNSKLKLANDFNQFEDVLGLKKKDGGIPSPTGLPASLPSQLPKSSTGRLIVTPLAYADDGQKAAVVQPNTITEKLFGNVRPEKQQLDVTPKVRNVEKEIEAEQVGKKITSDAIKNTLKAYKDRLSGDGTYNISDTDPALINQKNDLEKDLKEGNLQVVKSKKTGQYILARKNDSIDSISQAYNNVKDKQAEDRFVANLSTIDKIRHYENKKALVKDEYLPSEPSGFGGAFGTLIGENITPLAELAAATTVVGKYGKYLGLAGDALANAKKFTSFLTFATDAGYSGYANNTEKVYNALRTQNPNGDKVSQMQHAERAGLVGEVSGLAGAGAMTGAFARLNTAAKNVNVQPLVSSLEQLAHHTVKESATQGAFAAGGSILSDLGAISQGVKMKPSEIAAGAAESAKGIAEFTAVMGSAMGIAAGFANVPKYVKAQATGILAKLNPVLVNDAYKEAEASGAAPIGTAEKAMQQINGFKEAQKKVPTDLPDENVNAISGIQQKIDKLEAQKKTLAPQFHDRIDAVIDSLRSRSKEIASSDKPLEKEVDDITQQPTNVRIEPAIAEEVTPVVEKVKPTETVESTTKALEEVAKNNPEKVADATSKVFEDAGFHRGTLSSKSDFINETYIGDLPFTGHYFVSNPKDVVQGGSRKGNEKAFRVVDFSKYNLLKFEDANSYFGTKRALKKMANDLFDVNSEEVVNDLLKNQNVSDRLKNKIKNFNANNDALDINAKIYKLEKLQESVKNTRDFNAINNEIDSLNEKLKSVKKVSFADNLKNILEEYKNKRKTEEFLERLETSILKSLGYEGVDVRGIKAEGGLKSPDGFSEGSVIFDLKPKTVSTPAEAYHDALKISEEKRTPQQKELIKLVNETLGESELAKPKEEVKPTEVKEKVNIVKLTDLPDRAFAVGMTVEKFEDLKSKIQKEGFTQPIIIDKESGNVLDGQSRLSVAQDLGIKNVPYIYMDNPTRTDLNEKIKELEKQYIPSQEVKPTEVDVVGVFHGTNEDFTEFKTNGLGVHFGTESQAKERGSRLVKADITLKKPFRMDDMGSDFDVARLADELLDAGLVTKEKKSDLQKNGTPEDIKNILKENGYDGIVYKNKNEDKLNPKDSYIVFDKSQIKEVKPTEAKTEVKPNLEEEYNSKSVDELIALKKKLYPNPDIEYPMTPEEKLLDKVIAKKFSEKNQEIIAKRKIAAEEVKPTEEQLKTKENAIQEPSTSSVLQYPQEGARETGGERGRVEPSKQGEAIAEKVKQVEGNEEEVKPKEYTSKTGRQKIVYDEKGNSKVIDTKTGKEVSRETAKKVFNEAADNYDFSKGKKASFEGAELKDEREVENYTIDNSSNPAEIAEVYARQELEPPILNSAETAIVNHGIGKVDVKSFKRFNDENNITFGLAKNWFQKGGKGFKLDAKAEEISAKTGVNVTPEDIGNFMVRFPSGARAEKLVENDIAYNARNKFEKLTGLPLTEEIAHKAIDYEFNKLTKEQQAIAEQDFKTRKQLEDAYWAEQPGAVKPAPEKGDNIATKQARKAEKGLKEPIVEKKPLEGIQKEYQEVINKTGERVREKAKLEFVERNFDSILNKLKEKIKEKCPT